MFNRKDEAQMLHGKESSGLISANDLIKFVYAHARNLSGKRSLL